MSTQSIRNIITNSISRIISDVKQRSKEEIKKNTQNISQNLISSKSIINHLKSNQNTETCSSKGKEQYEKKSDKIKKELNEAENVLLKSTNRLQELENKIKGLTTQNTELPPGVSNPFESIRGITNVLNPLTSTLNNIIKVAPAILAAQVGLAANGKIIAATNNNINKAKSLISEYENLFRSLPKITQTYQKIADPIYENINFLKETNQSILDQISISKAFLVYLEMDHLDKCNQLEDPYPPDSLVQEEPPLLTLEDIINQTNEIYGNILEELIAEGNTKAIERMYTLNEEIMAINQQVGVRTINPLANPTIGINPSTTSPNTSGGNTYTGTTNLSERY